MNRKQRNTLLGLFAHPASSNIDPRQAFSALGAIGAEVTHGGHGQIMIKLNGHTQGFHDSRHALSKEEVSTLRKFLGTAGIDPARDFPTDSTTA